MDLLQLARANKIQEELGILRERNSHIKRELKNSYSSFNGWEWISVAWGNGSDNKTITDDKETIKAVLDLIHASNSPSLQMVVSKIL